MHSCGLETWVYEKCPTEKAWGKGSLLSFSSRPQKGDFCFWLLVLLVIPASRYSLSGLPGSFLYELQSRGRSPGLGAEGLSCDLHTMWFWSSAFTSLSLFFSDRTVKQLFSQSHEVTAGPVSRKLLRTHWNLFIPFLFVFFLPPSFPCLFFHLTDKYWIFTVIQIWPNVQ